MILTNEYKILLELVRSAMSGDVPNVPFLPNYKCIRELAQRQTILPLCFSAIQRLPKEYRPQGEEMLNWIAHSTAIEAQNRLVNSVLLKTHETLVKAGVAHVFMKGQTVAARYDNPLLRTCGDIDFVVGRGGYDRCLKALEKIGNVDYELKHEHHGMIFVDGVVLEPHYKVHNYQSAKNDKNMDELLYSVFPDKLQSVEIDGVEIPVFPVTFESVFLISHIVNHVYEEGVGLRQLCDWVMLLRRDADKIDWQLHDYYLSKIRMTSSFKILGYMCETFLGLSPSVLCLRYTKSEKRMANRLFADILKGGNFGRGNITMKKRGVMDDIRNYMYVTGRAIKFYGFCPSEARNWPIAKMVRYFKKTFGVSLR